MIHVVLSNYSECDVSLEKIRDYVIRFFGISKEFFESKYRTSKVVMARRIYSVLCKSLTKFSLAQIGISIGDRDHSTIINLIRGFDNLINTEPELKIIYDNIRADILGYSLPHPDKYHYVKPKSAAETVKEMEISKPKFQDYNAPKVEHPKDPNYSYNRERRFDE